jgi:hypothetical protein
MLPDLEKLLDLLTKGVDSFEGLWSCSVSVALGTIVIHVASLDDLIAMKKAANRAKDRLHLLELEVLKELQGD